MDNLNVPTTGMNGNMNVRIFLLANYNFSCNIVRHLVF